ncbi:MAG: histone deacetylase [Hyphomonadaceae bacterium]|nr:histone deacetylase [Hyphomonadaceae bacterium]
MRDVLPIIHHPDYDASSVGDDHRFPMRKYSLVAELLSAQGHSFEQPVHASQAALERAHDPAYVQAVLTSSLDAKSARRVGFEMTPNIAARTRASVGGTELAARRALETGRAVNLAGGSHHADYQGGAGFCVFNDVAVAALALLEKGAVQRVAVIDLDVHHGDGTALIFAEDPRVFTASLHCQENWPRTKPPSDLDIGLPKGTGDAVYLAATEKLVTDTLTLSKPDLVFFNAGVDPHAEDRLGLLSLTDDGLKLRDASVAGACAKASIPLVGVLGGGYSKDAEAIARRHTFLVEALQEFS